MGFGMTFGKFFSHLFTEPLVALGSLPTSIKDIIEILFFYFSKLSLTCCYIIPVIIAVRFLLKKIPKTYSYALWSIVYFKLVSAFRIDMLRFNIVPQAKLDNIYYDLAPDYTAFYSAEAGIISQVQSEFVAPVPVVTPIYIPALIWCIGVVMLLLVSLFSYTKIAYSTSKTSTHLYDNIYTANISVPFVCGVIKPKIFLPNGLTEIQQNYVISHEKAHIKGGDHIIKPVAFFITCLHWFNPLVWLSFFLMEKDMEMSCDEKVLNTLGFEHKKDYSYCILSLAAQNRFIPKAYLSFGDSDTQKRIKNVLGYKKPAVIISAIAVIAISVIFAGMFGKAAVVAHTDNLQPLNEGYTYETLFDITIKTDPVFREEHRSGEYATFSYNADDKEVKYIRHTPDGKPELEAYKTYHADGRVKQDLKINYKDGVYSSSTLMQYDYKENSKEVTATIWCSKGDAVGTDSVIHSMEHKDGEIYIQGVYDGSTDYVVKVSITEIITFYDVYSTYTQYYAGNAAYTEDIVENTLNNLEK